MQIVRAGASDIRVCF